MSTIKDFEKKSRHNINLKNKTWMILQELKKIKNKSISNIIDEAVDKYLKDSEYNTLYFKLLSTLPEVSDEENIEILNELKKLTNEDMEVVKIEKL
ncbi:hypothetical protein [Marinitoga aeolica]|uniref:Ribbon-helix-helix protein CopG domain-containing protein n=1 Tax=Marinitoga aeolica TaxID=2809031 RepID=A0ABY8PTD4_9BACT|nr:hypothetical protein [Marinitoga aeolica]WGS65906.1 hypothetical protein JRV97_04980 [Marinitoga aeolica]